MMRKVRSYDVNLVSSYLHDAGFLFSDIDFKRENRALAISVNRIYYEAPKKGRFLFFFHYTRFRHINSRVEVPNTVEVEYQWQNDAFNRPDDAHTLLSIRLSDHEFLDFETEYMLLRARVSKFDGIFITDIAAPTRYRTMDFSGRNRYSELVESIGRDGIEEDVSV